jgi:hypothetical protein
MAMVATLRSRLKPHRQLSAWVCQGVWHQSTRNRAGHRTGGRIRYAAACGRAFYLGEHGPGPSEVHLRQDWRAQPACPDRSRSGRLSQSPPIRLPATRPAWHTLTAPYLPMSPTFRPVGVPARRRDPRADGDSIDGRCRRPDNCKPSFLGVVARRLDRAAVQHADLAAAGPPVPLPASATLLAVDARPADAWPR